MATQSESAPMGLLGRVGYVILSVRDVGRSVRFYRDLLGLAVKSESPGWVEFDMGHMVLVVHPYPGMMPFNHSNAMPEIVFEVEDVMGSYTRLCAKGLFFSHAPLKVSSTADAEGMSAEFRDPDGNRLSIFGLVPKCAREAVGAR
jgi:lactoylglutathione lyase